jgi:hypothetical protein
MESRHGISRYVRIKVFKEWIARFQICPKANWDSLHSRIFAFSTRKSIVGGQNSKNERKDKRTVMPYWRRKHYPLQQPQKIKANEMLITWTSIVVTPIIYSHHCSKPFLWQAADSFFAVAEHAGLWSMEMTARSMTKVWCCACRHRLFWGQNRLTKHPSTGNQVCNEIVNVLHSDTIGPWWIRLRDISCHSDNLMSSLCSIGQKPWNHKSNYIARMSINSVLSITIWSSSSRALVSMVRPTIFPPNQQSLSLQFARLQIYGLHNFIQAIVIQRHVMTEHCTVP